MEAAPAQETARISNGLRHGRSLRRRPQLPPLLGRSLCVFEPSVPHLPSIFPQFSLVFANFFSSALPLRNHLAVGAAVVQGQRRSSDRRRPQRLQQPRHNRSRRRFRSRHLSSKRRSRLPRCCSGSPGSSRALPPSRRATTSSSPEMRQRPSPGTLRQPPRLLAPDRQIPPPFPL